MVENKFIIYLKSYAHEMQSYLLTKKEEFFNGATYKRLDLCDVSKEKLEQEITKVNSIIFAYERFKQSIK